MASGKLFNGLGWSVQPVIFHTNTGLNIRRIENESGSLLSMTGYGPSKAIRMNAHLDDNGIVFTSYPVPVGQMFAVTVKETVSRWLVGGMKFGFTKENPDSFSLEHFPMLKWQRNQSSLLYFTGSSVRFNEDMLARLDFDVGFSKPGQELGLLLTKFTTSGQLLCHLFVNRQWKGTYPLKQQHLFDEPMWGVVDVYGRTMSVTANIYTVSTYSMENERHLLELGLIKVPIRLSTQILPTEELPPPGYQESRRDQRVSEDMVSQLLQEQTRLKEQMERKDEEIRVNEEMVSQLLQEQARLNQQLERKDEEIQSLKKNEELQREASSEISHFLEQLSDAIDTQDHPKMTNLRRQIDVLQYQVTSKSPNSCSQEVEFWQVSPEEVTIREDQILGGGAWGYVAKATFRGTSVAVKRVYPEILQEATLERIRREIRTMAQIRHPNLVLFIAAVLNERTGPMIVTELLDTSLRSAYQANRIGMNKRKIFGDVSSALVYLHGQREPIIHRDVSSANVLLASQPNDTWLAKLGDFGSANLARYATTPGEGAILYTAPEAYPHPPTSPTPRPPQTTKIDVYSFGVVACEVVTGVFPESDKFRDLLERVGGVWPQIHPLITSCVSHSPQDRPTMDTVLSQIRQLDWEP